MTVLNANPLLLTWMPSGGEMIVLLLIIIVFFGGKKIPELARGLGRGIREFNEAKDGIKSEIESGLKDKDKINSTSSNNNQ